MVNIVYLTSLQISTSSFSVGFCPKLLITVAGIVININMLSTQDELIIAVLANGDGVDRSTNVTSHWRLVATG